MVYNLHQDICNLQKNSTIQKNNRNNNNNNNNKNNERRCRDIKTQKAREQSQDSNIVLHVFPLIENILKVKILIPI